MLNPNAQLYMRVKPAISRKMNYIRRLSSDVSGIYKLSDGNPEFVVRYHGVVYLRGETFRQDIAKYLCGAAVEKLFKDSQLRPKRVNLTISNDMEHGITVLDPNTKAKLEFNLKSIAFCCTDFNRPKVFSFLADIDDALQCHVFGAEREDKARLIALTLRNTFQEAFSNWGRTAKKDERIKGRKTGYRRLQGTLKEIEETTANSDETEYQSNKKTMENPSPASET